MGVFGVGVESFAESAAKAGPVEYEGGNVSSGKGEVRAGGILGAALCAMTESVN